jgi:hypothetical protein
MYLQELKSEDDCFIFRSRYQKNSGGESGGNRNSVRKLMELRKLTDLSDQQALVGYTVTQCGNSTYLLDFIFDVGKLKTYLLRIGLSES